jgi:hypothetical protein
MTLLVLLATPTRTGVIATNFRGIAPNLLRLGLGRYPTVTHQDLPLGRTTGLLNALRILLAGNLHGEELLDHVFLHPLREFFKHGERLFLVLL